MATHPNPRLQIPQFNLGLNLIGDSSLIPHLGLIMVDEWQSCDLRDHDCDMQTLPSSSGGGVGDEPEAAHGLWRLFLCSHKPSVNLSISSPS